MLFEIKDIYKYQQSKRLPMLSNYQADFWEPYLENFDAYDRIFLKKYRSWFPMDQDDNIKDVSENFYNDVEGWLTINDKRYSELFRVQTILDDEQYSLTDNVYEVENITKETSNSGTMVKGSETITDEAENEYGSRQDSDTRSTTIGSQVVTDTRSKTIGAQTVSEDKSQTVGNGEKTTTNSTSAYNESGYTATDKSQEVEASRTNTEDNTTEYGSHTDSETATTNTGQRADSENIYRTVGTHTDNLSNTRIEGQRSDTTSDEGTEEVSRNRHGNIGVKTVDQMLEDHKVFWVDFSFYDMIFADIARELLRGV